MVADNGDIERSGIEKRNDSIGTKQQKKKTWILSLNTWVGSIYENFCFWIKPLRLTNACMFCNSLPFCIQSVIRVPECWDYCATGNERRKCFEVFNSLFAGTACTALLFIYCFHVIYNSNGKKSSNLILHSLFTGASVQPTWKDSLRVWSPVLSTQSTRL